MIHINMAYRIFTKKFFFHLILILELALTLVLVNVFVGIYGNSYTLYRPYENILKNSGVAVNYDGDLLFDGKIKALKEELGEDTDIYYSQDVMFIEEDYEKYGLPVSSLPRDGGMVEIILPDTRILSELKLPLSEGRWLSMEKDNDGCIEAVITGGTDAEVGNIYDTPAGKIKIVGILSDDTYELPTGYSLSFGEDLKLTDFYEPFNPNVNLRGSYMIFNRELIEDNTGEEVYLVTTPLIFISYGQLTSSEEASAIETTVKILSPEEEQENLILADFSQLRKNTDEYMTEFMMELLPIAVAVIIIAAIGIAGTSAILALRNLRNFSIFYLCGSKWSDCIKIMLADIGIVTAAALVLNTAAIFTLTALNMESLIGMDIGIMNVLVTLGTVAAILIISVILPINVLKSKTPVECLREEN